MKNSLIRVIISLFLCCCLVLNVVSLPAKAVTPGMVAVGTVSALVLIPAILYGLGVMQGVDSSAFNQVVSDCNDFLTDAGYIVAGAATMLSLTQDGTTITYAHRNMIQDIFDWLFDSGTVSGPAYSLTLEGHSIICAAPINYFVAQNWDYSMNKFKRTIYIFSTEVPFVDGSHNGNTAGPIDGVYYPWSSISLGYYDYDSSIFEGGIENYITQFGYDISSDVLDGLVAGQIAEQDTDIETGYETYIQEGIVSIDFGIQFEEGSPYDPDGDDQKYHHWFPVKVPSPDNLSNLTQEDAWSGESEVELEYKTDTDTGTDSGNGSGNGSGNTGTNTGTNFLESLTQFFTPSGDITMYSLDLKELFPFCIPFDIYNFLAALSADPVAPVFEFDLNLGVATEPMKIDLSNWSDLAAIIRTLELGLFCVGLALKTRELIGG